MARVCNKRDLPVKLRLKWIGIAIANSTLHPTILVTCATFTNVERAMEKPSPSRVGHLIISTDYYCMLATARRR
eukprot:6186894-Pleurochrysis_carterae.AAC.3